MHPKIRQIIYEWEDGKTLRLSLEQWEQIWSFVGENDLDAYQRCLRFLADLPSVAREMYHGQTL